MQQYKKCFYSGLLAMVFICLANCAGGSTLTGSFSPIAQGSNVNLTATGTLDWVHWGLLNMNSLNRKATVAPQISNFTLLYNANATFANAYQYTDNYNGYTWSDGSPSVGVTNTMTGVYVVGAFNITETNGFQITVPADTTLKTLKVFVGTYAAKGKFQAILSDSAVPYNDTTSLDNFSNGPGGVFTINFAANSSNQTLTVKWTVGLKHAPDGNVTLQAATLSASGVNNPPFSRIISPANNSSFTAPANISLNAEGSDADGTISKVEYYQGATKLGEATTAGDHYAFTWSNVAPGAYTVFARVTDNGGASSTSSPISVFVNTNGGTLVGSATFPPNSVDLTAEGNADWAHWGLATANSFDHKILGGQQISNLVKIGTNTLQRFGDDYTTYAWTDGTPTPSTNSTTGVFISGPTNGFQLTLPADKTTRTATVYVGAYASSANFQAYLSDFSASAYTSTNLINTAGNAYGVYTLNYAAAAAGQNLIIKFTSLTQYDQLYGNVTLQSATLQGPAPVILLNPGVSGDSFSFSFATVLNKSYVVTGTPSLDSPITWQTVTNVVGDGNMATITVPTAPGTKKFYRVEVQ